jgi:hypothetical protein
MAHRVICPSLVLQEFKIHRDMLIKKVFEVLDLGVLGEAPGSKLSEIFLIPGVGTFTPLAFSVGEEEGNSIDEGWLVHVVLRCWISAVV